MNHRKGIILAGGRGSRLFPITRAANKQMLPVYNKPMIYYPLSVLMNAGIQEFLIISSPDHISSFQNLFGDGSHLGISIKYETQEKPGGIAEAFLIGEDFIGNDNVALILGDNIFHGNIFRLIKKAMKREQGSTIFSYYVKNPQDYGVVNFYEDGTPMMIVEKPKNPKSNYAITGLYFYDNQVVEFAKSISCSGRGELEISDINQMYLDLNQLHVEKFHKGTAWLDTGTQDNLMAAAQYVEVIEKRTGMMIGNIEEIAYRRNFIEAEQLSAIANSYGNNEYSFYLKSLLPVEWRF